MEVETDPQRIIAIALHELELMKGKSVIDYGRLQQILQGRI